MRRLDEYTDYSRRKEKTNGYKLKRRSAKQKKYMLWYSRRNDKHPGYLKDGAVEDVIYIPPTNLGRALRDHNYQSNQVTVLGHL